MTGDSNREQEDRGELNAATGTDEVVEITVTVERTYSMNLSKIRRDFGTEIAEDIAAHGRSEYHVLRETFGELCGFDRDEDHIDGTYVWLEDEDADYDSRLTLRGAVPA